MTIQPASFNGTTRNYLNPAQRKQPFGYEGKYFAGSGDTVKFSGVNHPYRKEIAGISLHGWFRKSPEQKFFKAVEKNDIAGVDTFLANGGNINHQDQWGFSALMLAASSGHADMVKHLINKGADKNLNDTNGYTALHFVVDHMRPFKAAQRKELAELVATPQNINRKDYYGHKTALYSSVEHGLDATSIALINKGAKATIAAKDGMTTLMQAAWNNQSEVAEALIQSVPAGDERTAFVNAKNKWNHDALHLARVYKKEETISVLLSHGAE